MLLPARKKLGYLSPAIAKHTVRLVNDEVLLCCPGRLLHVRVEMVVPTLPTLLAKPASQMFCHHSPLLVAIFIDQLYHLNVKMKYNRHRGCQMRFLNTLVTIAWARQKVHSENSDLYCQCAEHTATGIDCGLVEKKP